jgi:nucleotide-binding universal stress UspA family protein
MKTFIVPTDFSETAKNAVVYAGAMAAEIPGAELVLYHAYPEIYAGSDSSPLNDDSNARQKIFDAALTNNRNELLAGSNTRVSYLAEERGSLIEGIEAQVKERNADMVIMGITGTSKLEQAIVGSNALSLAKKNVCPVMIVPPDAHYKGIKNIIFASDLKPYETSTTMDYISKVLELFRASVHIVHVSEDPSSNKEVEGEKDKLLQLLKNFNPQFYHIKDKKVTDTIDQFAIDNNIDLILTVPRKHGLGGLFEPAHTKKLVYHSHVPVIAVHE